MGEGEDAGRPKRRSARSKQAAAPSAVHYVGYVEEDETPEAIMKKFEELEKVRFAIRDTAFRGILSSLAVSDSAHLWINLVMCKHECNTCTPPTEYHKTGAYLLYIATL